MTMQSPTEHIAGAATEAPVDPPEDWPEVRLLILCAGDPEAERTFSGSARSLFRALERRGIVYAKANVTKGFTDVFSPPALYERALRKIDYFGLIDRYRWSVMSYAANTRRARAMAKAHPGFNACLMYGTNFNPKLDVPTYCYFDATAPQVFRGAAWEFSRLGERRAKNIIAYQRSVFDHCTAIFPRSEWAAASVRDDYGVAEDRICVAGAGANHEFDPIPHEPYDRQTILFIGREWERKGGPLILDAFQRVRQKLPNARLVIVGCTPPVDGPNVVIAGVIKKDAPGGMDQLLRLYSQASLFCVMSTFEPFGIVIIEAQHCGVPCVVPAKFAFTETVVDGVTGRHAISDTPEELAAIFLELLGDPVRLEAMGEAARSHVRTNYTWDIAAERIHRRIAHDVGALHPGIQSLDKENRD